MSFLQKLFGPPDIEKLKANGDIEGLIKALGYNKDASVPKAAAKALGQLDDTQAVKALVTALQDDSSQVRIAAAEVLGQFDDKQAVEGLVTAIQDDSLQEVVENIIKRKLAMTEQERKNPKKVFRRLFIVNTLGHKGGNRAVRLLLQASEDGPDGVGIEALRHLAKIGDKRTFETFVALLRDENWHKRKVAVLALGNIGDDQAIEPLKEVLKNDSPHFVLEEASRVLGSLGWQPDRNETGALYWLGKREWEKCVEIGAPAVEPLITVLEDDENWRIQGFAARALGQIGGVRAVDSLIAALETGRPDARESAAEALGQIGDSRAVDSLIAALGYPRPNVRRAVAEALGQIDDVRAVEPLIAALKDKDKDARKAATRALGQISDIRAVNSLIAILGDFWVGHDAAEALEKIGAPAIEPLVAALKDAGARQNAAKVLGNLGWQPGRNETGALYWLGLRQWDKCVELGAPAVEPLIAALRSTTTDVCQNAFKALGQMGDARAVEPITTALGDSEEYKRVSALEALVLGKFTDARIVKPLVELIKARSPYTIRRHKESRGVKTRQISDKEEAVLAGKALIIVLEHAASDTATDELREVAGLDNVVQITQFITECGRNAGAEEDVAFDSSHLKQLARQELIRRGLQA